MINIVIPMAGRGQRFVDAGFEEPKPFLKFKNNKRLIEVVTENVTPKKHECQIKYLVLSEHIEEEKYKIIAGKNNFIKVNTVTEGAASTVLLSKDFINNENALLLANSDQYVDFDIDLFIEDAIQRNLDGSMVTFTATENKWSFAKIDDTNLVTEVAEKNPISNIATVGIYYWKHGKDFVKYAEQMIEKNIRVNGEFYVCPVFNEAIKDNKKISIFNVENMYGFGTPEDWEKNEKIFSY